MEFETGDTVEWEQHEGEWIGPLRVEKKYNATTYRVGNQNFFVDLVHANSLRREGIQPCGND